MNDEGVLEENTYMTVATVCADGAPWSVPVKYAFYKDAIYWRSAEDTQHSKNIIEDPRVSISIYDVVLREGQQERQGFYLQSFAKKIEGEESRDVLNAVGHRFSNRDESSPIYRAPIGAIDRARSTDNRFYRTYDSEVAA